MLFLMKATDKRQLSDKAGDSDCLSLVNYSCCVPRSQPENKTSAFVLGLGGGMREAWSVFFPSVLLVSQNLLQMESKISAPQTDLFCLLL